MATLKEALEYAAQNPTSDFANQLKMRIQSGAADYEAQQLGIDLTPIKNQAEAEIESSNLPEDFKQPGFQDWLSEPSFPITDDGSLMNIPRAAGNLPKSLLRLTVGIGQFLNPVENIKKIAEAGREAGNLFGDVSSAITSREEGDKLLAQLKQQIAADKALGKDTSHAEMALARIEAQPSQSPITSAGQFTKDIGAGIWQNIASPAIQELAKGNFTEGMKSLAEDPYQLAPYFLMLQHGLKGDLGKTKTGQAIDTGISKTAQTVAEPFRVVGGKITRGVGNLGAQILGAETGAGASSIKSALRGSQDFVDSMRGKTTPEEVVGKLNDAFSKLKQNRASEYTSKLKVIGGDKGSIDVSPINTALRNNLIKFGVSAGKDGQLDFSQSPIRFDKTAQTDIQNIYDTMKDFGFKSGDRTPAGVDSLKRAFGDLYTKSSNVRAFIQDMKSTTRDVLNKNVPGYEEMTKGYNKASQLLDEIQSATGAGGKPDTVFTKLTAALKGDKEFRLQMLNELENGSGQKLIDAIAGQNMSKWIPSGLIGKGMDIGAATTLIYHVFDPAMIPLVLTTSPRIVGEFLNAVGVAKNYVPTIVNAMKTIVAAPVEDRVKAAVEISKQNRGGFIDPNAKIGGESTLKNSTKNNAKNESSQESHADSISQTPAGSQVGIESLLQEAKKYKSAEEFVKAQGEPVFRGGKLDNSKITSRGVSVTTDEKIAQRFPIQAQTRSPFYNESGQLMGYKQTPLPTESFILPKDAKVLQFNEIPKKFLSETSNGIVMKLNAGEDMWIGEQRIIDYAKAKGFDAVDLQGLVKGAEKEIRIINPDILKTKSQLTDIWEKANKK